MEGVKRPSCPQGSLGAIPGKLCSMMLKQVMFIIPEPYMQWFINVDGSQSIRKHTLFLVSADHANWTHPL